MDTARHAVHDLFSRGFIDEDHATAALLAIDLGRRRAERVTRLVTTLADLGPPLHDFAPERDDREG